MEYHITNMTNIVISKLILLSTIRKSPPIKSTFLIENTLFPD